MGVFESQVLRLDCKPKYDLDGGPVSPLVRNPWIISSFLGFTTRLWNLIKDWLGIPAINTRLWAGFGISDWWSMMSGGSTPNRNARVFHYKQAPTHILFDKIKKEAHLCMLADAKYLGEMMPEE
jgi:hypothetical protein